MQGPGKNFIDELRWRGMIHDIMPGTEELLKKESTAAYIGFDPTADSLHIGHLVSVMILKHFQSCGHKPIVLLGGATGMIGDPSGRSEERNLLSEDELRRNQEGIKKQFEKFLDFSPSSVNHAEMVNNYDWMKEYSFLGFIRDIGKHITVNYMMSKESVKKRIGEDSGTGMSFTEFSYQLVQAVDFLELYRTKGCRLQMGGSDQWGNITTGSELIRRKTGGEAYALTCPLITKADGSKFGKTESGNVWLDPEKTSPYQFFQFWLNSSDTDAEKYIKIFTLLGREEIDGIIQAHREAPQLRTLQKRLAGELTRMVHSEADLQAAVEAAAILFGSGTGETLRKISEKDLLDIFDGVPHFSVPGTLIANGVNILDLLSVHAKIFASKGEARRMITAGGVSLNQEKAASPDAGVGQNDLLNGRIILVRTGKKNYSLITTE